MQDIIAERYAVDTDSQFRKIVQIVCISIKRIPIEVLTFFELLVYINVIIIKLYW